MDLKRKVGPLPLYAWLALGAVGAYLAFKMLASRSSNGSGTATQTVSATQPTGQSSQLGLPTQAGSAEDTGQATQDYLSALGTQSSVLLQALGDTQARLVDLTQIRSDADTQARQDALTAQSQSNAGVVDAINASAADTLSQLTALFSQTAVPANNTETQPIASTEPNSNAPIYVYVNPATVGTGDQAVAQTAAQSSASASTPDAQPFGGVVSVKTLPNKSTVTTYANGRQVQQAPGKSPYVIKR